MLLKVELTLIQYLASTLQSSGSRKQGLLRCIARLHETIQVNQAFRPGRFQRDTILEQKIVVDEPREFRELLLLTMFLQINTAFLQTLIRWSCVTDRFGVAAESSAA